jgi:hypothetical protein
MSDFNALSESGYIVDTAYQRGHCDGRSVWQYDSSTGVTTRLGIYDALHTRASGEQFSRFRLMNDQGLVAGESYAEWMTPNGEYVSRRLKPATYRRIKTSQLE